MLKKYGLFDINSNGFYTFKYNDEIITSNDFSLFLDFLKNNKKNLYIIVNNNLEIIIKKFQEYNLELNENYKFVKKNKNVYKGITYIKGKKCHVYFRDYSLFFGTKLFNDVFANIEQMDQDIQEFISLSKMNAFYKNYDLFSIIHNDFRKALNWEENYRFKITDDEFNEMIKHKGGGFNLINPEFLNKIVKISLKVDQNAFYQWISESKSMPFGKPLYCKWNWNEDNLETCNHELNLITADITAKLKKGKLPIITKKETFFDYTANSRYLSEVRNEIIYTTGDKLQRIFESYDIEYCKIIRHVCFESQIGLLKEYNKKWIVNIKNKTKNLKLKEEIKRIINIIVGTLGSEKERVYTRYLPKSIDKNNNVEFKKYEIRVNDNPYIPLYLFITDHARNYISDIAQQYRNNFVASKTDSLTFQNLDLKDFEYEIKPNKIGAFKLEDAENFYYYKNSGVYISANDVNKKNGIVMNKHSGSKGIDIKDKSFMDVVNIWESQKRPRN